MSDTDAANDMVIDAIDTLVKLLDRKTKFGKFEDDAIQIVESIAKLRASMNPTIINNQ